MPAGKAGNRREDKAMNSFCRNVFLIGLMLGLCNWTTPLNGQTRAVHQSVNNRSTAETLQSKLVDVDFHETRLSDVFKWLNEETGIEFQFHESAADNNFDEDSIITLKMNSTRLETVLQIMLEQYQCTWGIRDGIVTMISEDQALDIEWMAVRVFDCADILAQIKPKTVREGMMVPVVGRNNGGFRGSNSGGGVFSITADQEDASGADPEQGQTTPSTEAPSQAPSQNTTQIIERTITPHEQLLNLINETIDPDSWEVGGGTGQMIAINDLLVVRQTADNVRNIEDLLHQLRDAGLGQK